MVRSLLFAGVLFAASLGLSPFPARPSAFPARRSPPPCDADNGGLTLPDGFCATLFGAALGSVRHLAVSSTGDVFVAVDGGGVLALRDIDGDGHADIKKSFGPEGGNGILLGDRYLYFATTRSVVRWPWKAGQLEPAAQPETIVQDLPSGGHSTKSLALGPNGGLYVSIGSASNSCQEQDRTSHSPGKDPCPELATRAGIWRFNADRSGQRQSDGIRFATGMRNAVAIAVDPTTGRLYAAVNGRDQLAQNWGFPVEAGAELPAEEFMEVDEGDDFGWPYCYFDQQAGKKVLAPEYGGDGKTVGRCAGKKLPLIGFPGHWAPIAMAFYTGGQFPAAYRGGVFLAFHGSWNRDPLPQAGYRVVFAPFSNGTPTGAYSTFAVDQHRVTGLRASGVAQGADGSLYVSADDNGKIWRVVARK